MSETENAPPSEVEGQSIRLKGALKQSGESARVSRTPFKDIGNNTSNASKSPMKLKSMTPSKFEAIRTLDDDENWRDRTEVVTKLDHTNYKLFAREIVDDVITELPVITSGTCPTPAKSDLRKMTFRDPVEKGMDDSVLGLDDTARVLDETVTFPSMDATLDPLNVPVANSTLLNASRSNPTTPNRSATVLENSLLSSFEKMKIKGIKEETEDDDEDIFHDASDDIDSFSETPSKGDKTKVGSALDENLEYSDPLDMLLSSLEKITVSEGKKSDEMTCMKEARLSTSKTKVIPAVEGETQEAAEKQEDCTSALANGTNGEKLEGSKVDFQDPDFNPFLLGTPTETVDKYRTVLSASSSPSCVSAKSGAPSVGSTDEEDVCLVAKADVEVPSSGDKEEIHPSGKDSVSENVLSRAEDLSFEPSSTLKASTVSSPSEELSKLKNDALVSHGSGKEIEAPISSTSSEEFLAVAKTDNLEDLEESDIPAKNYDIENILSREENPSFDPFISKSNIINSPDVGASQVRVGNLEKSKEDTVEMESENETGKLDYKKYSLSQLDDSKVDPFVPHCHIVNSPDIVQSESQEHNGDSSQSKSGKSMPEEDAPSLKKDYNLEAVLNSSDPTCDPFASKSLVVNSPDDKPDKVNASDDFDPFATKSAVNNSPDRTSKTPNSEKLSSLVVALKEKCSEIVENEMRSPQEEGNNASGMPVVVSPKRKYEEAFAYELSPKRKFGEAFADEEEDEKLAASDTTSEEGKCMENNDKLMQTTVEELTLADDQSEEVILPTKGYNLDFLDALDDPNFNPFETKAAVNNSPGKTDSSAMGEDKGGVKNKATGAVLKEKTIVAKTNNPAVAKSEKSEEEEENAQQKKEKDVAGDAEISRESVKINKEIDDLQSVTTLKSLVPPNSQSDKQPQDVSQAKDELSEQHLEEDDDIVVPKKGYQLDFLDNLDDPNYNPFSTKTSVMNSPERGPAEAKTSGDKTEATHQEVLQEEKKTDDSIQSSVDVGKSAGAKPTSVGKNIKVALKKKPNVTKPKVEESEVKTSEGMEEEEIPVPKKGYQLDFLDKLDDPKLNPFATKSSVMNSPERGPAGAKISEDKIEAPCQEVLQEEKQKDPTQSSVDTEKSTVEKPKSVCKNVKATLKKKPVTKPKVEESEVKTSEGMEEEEIPVPKKGYQLDFLDNLDDPNFNPFATKTAVSNSPSKDNSQAAKDVVGQTKAVCEEKRVCEHQKNSDGSTPEVKNLDVVQEAASVLKYGELERNVDIQASKVEATEGKDVESNDKKETLLPKKNYSLDILNNLDDPNFNPFASKVSVSNSPKKDDSTPSVEETKKEKSKEQEPEVERDNSTAGGSSSTKQVPNVKKMPAKEKLPATSETCPPPSEKPTSSVEDEMFNAITKEAMKLATEVTPSKKRLAERKTPLASVQSQQRDIFSPQVMAKSRESSGIYNFEEFVNATDFFNNPGDLDVLGEHGTDGDKLNLVRNSLYMKFDPLVSGRQSLAPYLAQQKHMQKEETDPRRASALICFSPSPDKTCRGENSKGTGTPARPLFKTRADETVVVETTTNMTMNETTVCEGHNATVVTATNPAQEFSTTILSQGGRLHDDTVCQEPVSSLVRMVPEEEMIRRIKEMEQEMNNKNKELEQTMRLVMQDKLLRQSRVLEELQRETKQQVEERDIALAGMEEENESLRSKFQQLQAIMLKVVEQNKVRSDEKERELTLMENKYELKCKALQEENRQQQDEVKKMEVNFYDLVKKYSRLQEATESLRRNEEMLKTENKELQTKHSKKEERFMTVLKTFEENYSKSQQEFQEEKERHDQERNKMLVLMKKSEVKILSLTETVEKKCTENQRLTALIDEITKNYS